jgi:hypothetical protein
VYESSALAKAAENKGSASPKLDSNASEAKHWGDVRRWLRFGDDQAPSAEGHMGHMTYGGAIAAEHSIEAGVNKVPGQEGARPTAPCGATKQCAQYWRERTVRGSFASSTLCCPGTGTLTLSVTAMLGSTDLSVTKWRSLRRTVVRCPDFSPF